MGIWIEVAVYVAVAVGCGLLLVGIAIERRPFLTADALVKHGGRYARVVSGSARRATIRYLGSDEVRRVAARSLERVQPFCCEVTVEGNKIRLIGPVEPWHAPDAEVVRSVTGWEPYRTLYRSGGRYFLVTG